MLLTIKELGCIGFYFPVPLDCTHARLSLRARLPSGQAVPWGLRPLGTAWPLGSLWPSDCIFTVLGLYTTGLMLSIQLFRKYQYSLRVISGHPSYCIHRVTWYWYKPSPVLIPAYSWYRWLVCIVFFSTDPTANHQQASKIILSQPIIFTINCTTVH